jgi:hypothetical protein
MQAHERSTGRERPRTYTREAWANEEADRALGFHITMRLADSGGIARTPGALRLASRIVLACGEERGIIAHTFADNHLHSTLFGDREEAGVFARCAETALRKRLPIRVPFERCRIRPIEDARHLHHTVRYGFTQEQHHGTAFDPAHDGSSLLDLLGLRVGASWLLPRFTLALPRVSRDHLLFWLGAPELDAATPDPRFIVDASAAALGVASLDGRSALHIQARRVAVQALDILVPDSDAAVVLDIPRRCVGRYLAQPRDAEHLRAVELQLKWRTLLDARQAAKRVSPFSSHEPRGLTD